MIMIFEIQAQKQNDPNDKKVFYYDNMKNILKDEHGIVIEYSDIQKPQKKEFTNFNKDVPLKKSRTVGHLKIQLGLSCNYSCDYCSQRFVERPKETNKKDIEDFMAKLDNLEFSEDMGLVVEFWGGEPLVYWKTLKPLAEAVKEKFKHWKTKPHFSIITNGSILTDEMIDWLMMMDFQVSISHDGPGQFVRGPDPFDDPETKEKILGFYRMMTRLKKPFSFNSMLNKQNMSRKAIYDWFVNLTGDENVQLGEGSIVDAYEEDGIVNSLTTKEDHFTFRRQAFGEIYQTDGNIGFKGVILKMADFAQKVLTHEEAIYLNQKCGMDGENVLAVDLRGNVITCQNVSAVETSKNGEPHLAGNLDNFDDVEITSSVHWSNRKECPSCPVLHLCKGACMFLDEKFWDISCANSYSDNVALFALTFVKLTDGYIPTLIKGDGLPLERQDIWGTIYEHKEEPKKKVIPIKFVAEQVGEIDQVPVYGKSRIESV
jgi:uncharacterized protein